MAGLVAPAVQRYWFEIKVGSTRNSADQVRLYMSCPTFVKLMIDDGWNWAAAKTKQGAGKLTKGKYTYDIYPVSNSTRGRAGDLRAAGEDYSVAKFRFNKD